ncbi:DNA double-strand break repair nuclease NurA [Candidatus Woesearchaeota archaeon]|nr:DNA double-strand break repair nuclease NurA [Candidatus Woesearchaeota archaeon]
MKKIIEDVVKAVKENIRFSDDTSLVKDNFKEIKDEKTSKKIVFIDGGNTEILASPDLSVHLIRTFFCVYQKNKRIKSERKEFFVLVKSVKKGKDIFYKTETFPKNKSFEFSFNSLDSELKTGNERVEISRIGGVIRRFAELEAAKQFKDSIVVLDGSLKPTYPGEKDFLKKLGNNVIGLSKTTRLFTKKGIGFANMLNKQGPKHSWIYKSEESEKNLDADIYFVKLNKNSKHVFRIDSKNLDSEVLALLKENSRDLSFPGYPYGLVEADRFARVSNNEKEMLNTIFSSKLSSFIEINKFLSSLNAHDTLDRLSH